MFDFFRNVGSKFLFICALIFLSCNKTNGSQVQAVSSVQSVVKDTIMPVTYQERVAYGFQLNDYLVEKVTINSGDTMGGILSRNNFTPSEVANIINKVRDSFPITRIRVGKTLTLLKSKIEPNKLKYLIYQPNKSEYSVIAFEEQIHAYRKELPITVKTNYLRGVVETSFSDAVKKAGADVGLAHYVSNKFKGLVNFSKMSKGDRFALYFTEKYINNEVYVGIDKFKGAAFDIGGKRKYGFPYTPNSTEQEDFYDQHGGLNRMLFLKAPLKKYRLTSRFGRRFHPVKRKYKIHKGTDFAAPRGTPIMSTAKGVVIVTGYNRGNGKYVKVKHNDTYTTQYLHMSKILVKKGQRVKQGQVIGLVGSTGTATGAHVCYRFWKNGEQVDPFKQKLPSVNRLKGKELKDFRVHIKPLKDTLGLIMTRKLKN